MHQTIQDGLEEYLAGTASEADRLLIEAHLTKCAECRVEVEGMMETSSLFDSLRSPEPPIPAPGFYARVTEVIEQQQASSFWASWLEPAFGRRLAFGSLMALAMLGTMLVSGESNDYTVGPSPEMILAVEQDTPFAAPVDHDQMLFTLASHRQ
jgi:predicted anti-sigma-YlaC factor YlaD